LAEYATNDKWELPLVEKVPAIHYFTVIPLTKKASQAKAPLNGAYVILHLSLSSVRLVSFSGHSHISSLGLYLEIQMFQAFSP
jgi:hypothetical protein